MKILNAVELKKPSNSLHIASLQLQNRVVEAISDAYQAGRVYASVVTAELGVVSEVAELFREAGYYVHVDKQEGVLGTNLIRLPGATITVRWP